MFCVKEQDCFLKYSLALDNPGVTKVSQPCSLDIGCFFATFSVQFLNHFQMSVLLVVFKPLSTYESSKLKRALNSRKINLHAWKTIYGRVAVKKTILGKRKKYIVAVATGLMDQNLTFLVKIIINICG